MELPEPRYRRFSRIELSTTDFHLNGYDDSVEMNQKFLGMFEQILEPTHPNIIDCHNSLGLAYSAKGDYMRAIISFEQALHLLQAAHDEGNEKIVIHPKEIIVNLDFCWTKHGILVPMCF